MTPTADTVPAGISPLEGGAHVKAHIRSVPSLAMAVVAALGCQPGAAEQTMNYSEPDLIGRVLPSVVAIVATEPGSAQGGAGTVTGPHTERGSGFVIDPSGLIATNNHVIAGAYQLQVTFSDGQTAPAKLVATASVIDIAVIKVETQHALVPVHWGDSNKLQIGDPVIAIGNALGLGTAVSAGVVSALDKNIDVSPYDDYIQTDASINHGNSGGPLLNAAGEVIGMDTALISPTTGSVGLGFAQPSANVIFVTGRLIRDGWVRPGWVGGTFENVTPDLANALGMPSPRGLIITSLTNGGPAATAGLQVGDVVLRFGDRTPEDSRALRRCIAETTVGQTVPIGVLRNGQERIVPVTVKVWPETAAEIKADSTMAAAPKLTIPADLGLSVSAITADLRARYGLDVAQAGVVINGIAAGTEASARGLSAGDVILRMQDGQVQTPEQVQAAIDVARAQHRSYVAALVLKKALDAPTPVWIGLRVSQP
jgi:serine protease Do